MKKITLAVLFIAFAITTNFAAKNSNKKVELNFNHCQDDIFKSVSLNPKKGILTVQVKPAVMPNRKEVKGCKKARFNWHFTADSTQMEQNRLHSFSGNSVIYGPGEDHVLGTCYSAPHPTKKVTLRKGVLTVRVKLNQAEIVYLSCCDALPDQKTAGFSAGNLMLVR